MQTSISEILKHPEEGKQVTLRGWVYRHRIGGAGSMVFAVLRDASGIIQATVKKEKTDEKSFKDAGEAYVESAVIVTGTVKKDERAPGGYEIAVEKFETVHRGEPFPVAKDLSEEYLLDIRHLWLRSQKLTRIMKIRSTLVQAIHEFFQQRGYTLFDPPILSPNACEGKLTLFEVKYFDTKMYLSQSWQLYAEAAIFALEKIYDVAPTFRAEKSKTAKHLAEFWMAEMEAAWLELDDVVQIAKDEIKFLVERVLEKHEEDLKFLGRDINKLKGQISKPFPTITYTEALEMLKEKEGMEVKWGEDLHATEEEKLMKHFDTPIAITNYPIEIMAFYKPKDPKNPKTALCFDMLAPEGFGEIVGGSQRSLNVEDIVKRIEKEGGNVKDYSWYMELRKYGSVPHSGYGVGVERVLRWICGLENIKDTIAFPRTMSRCYP
ncbi:MAG TPA: asparagine--tRNA ligase [Candidatus Bilamarchaeaceae archaeon]|nr:asparagine--tRNA ligase [Candidatus Bilamarchaeaceae archaeon]